MKNELLLSYTVHSTTCKKISTSPKGLINYLIQGRVHLFTLTTFDATAYTHQLCGPQNDCFYLSDSSLFSHLMHIGF